MALIAPRSPQGTMELLPRQQIAFQRMLDTVRNGFELYGFVPVETPVFETVEVLLTKSGGETEKQVYFVQSTGQRAQGREPEMALRFDLTVPLARYVAEHEHELAFPFRRYQMQRVYRGERPQKGRYREFYQCDIDVIGKDSLALGFDAELPAVIWRIFTDLGVGGFVIRINNRKLLRGLCRAAGLADEAVQAAALREIDKLDKIGRDGVLAQLTEQGLLPADKAAALLERLDCAGAPAEVLAKLAPASAEDPLVAEGLAELETVTSGMAALGVPADAVRLDPTIARGLDYYTGTVYETFLTDAPQLGSVCSGGRYENLAGHYTKSRLPGVGISIGATRLFSHLLATGRIDASRGMAAVMVCQMDAALAGEAQALSARLRSAGIRTELYPEPAKLAKQIKHADRAGIPLVALLAPDELKRGEAVLKRLSDGEQRSVPLDAVADAVQDFLA